jgi:UDP-N-acetylglucosamine diphosphorylase / glucose-1-phosphate thymidylyltransferase / UDP-N-acetylgalactosamine diphosphorylase / glucosamine-1-phosphate N-acetyltransferase / galactosamine-1-phosphate N-acetyltransferase
MHVVIFEGQYWKSFGPLSLGRPVFMLSTGTSTLLEKQIRHLQPTRLTLWVRKEFEQQVLQRVVPKLGIPTQVNVSLDDEPALVVSGRTLHLSKFEYPGEPAAVIDEQNLIHAAFVQSPGLAPDDVIQRTDNWLKLLDMPRMPPQTRMVENLWDLIKWNEESLIEDSTRKRECHTIKLHPGVHLVNDEDVCMGRDVSVEPGCVIDASQGPVVLGERAVIGANSVLQGPCYIGPYSVLRPLTLIRPGTSVGMMSRVGGEISRSIIHGYSNKAHDGYLGDSYVGKWVNLGAGTTTSNKKNTHGEISVRIGEREVPTGRRFLGSLIGDHVKTGILTRLTTGSYVGFCSQLAGSGIAPRFLPSFSYWTDRGLEPYRMEKAIEVVQRTFARRDRPWSQIDEQIMRYVGETAPQVEK